MLLARSSWDSQPANPEDSSAKRPRSDAFQPGHRDYADVQQTDPTAATGSSFNIPRADRAQKTPVDVLAERLQELSISQGFGCISGPGIISGHPCPVIEQHVRCRFEVGGVEVFFPFAQPLEPQKAVMKSVLEALSLGNWAEFVG